MNRLNCRRIDRFAMSFANRHIHLRELFSRHRTKQFISSNKFRERKKETRQSDEEIGCAQCLPAGACFLNGELTKWPSQQPDKSSSSVQYLYMYYHRKWVVDWPSVLCTCTLRIMYIYISLSNVVCVFVYYYYFFLLFLFHSFFPLFAFYLLKRRAKPARRSRNLRDIRCARPAQQHPTRVALLAPCMGIDSGNETFKSSLISIR